MPTMLYTVLPASGGWVDGQPVAINAQIPLTDEEARYVVALGHVAPTGLAPPQPPPPPALLPGDLIATRRGDLDRAVVIAALEAFLVREGGWIAEYLAERDEDLAARLSLQGASLDGLRADLLGGVDAAYNTLAKLATALAPLAPRASPVLTGTPTAPTAAPGTDTQQLATTAFVQAAAIAAIETAMRRGRRLDLSQAPTAAQLADGEYALVKNTLTGRTSLFHNDGGTIVDVLNGSSF